MEKRKTISGFSKLNKLGKIKWIVENFFKDPEEVLQELKSYSVSYTHLTLPTILRV